MSDEVLRLQSSYSPVRLSDDRLALVSTVLQRRLTLGGCSERVARALEALSTGVDADRAIEAVIEASKLTREEAGRLLRELGHSNVLVKRAADDDVSSLDSTSLYDRQIRFLSLFESAKDSGIRLNSNLQHRKVVIPGVGGTGGWIALLCARIGIRNISVIDCDEVELSNLHRQILYDRNDIGMAKVDACVARLSGIDDEIKFSRHKLMITRAEDITAIVQGADLVFNAFPPFDENFSVASAAVAQAALRAGVPCLQMPAAHCIGPLTIPGHTACQRCARGALTGDFSYSAKVVPPWYKDGFVGALSPRQAITGGLAVWEAARFLSGMDRPPTLDGTVRIDIANYGQHNFIRVARDPACEECGDHRRQGQAKTA